MVNCSHMQFFLCVRHLLYSNPFLLCRYLTCTRVYFLIINDETVHACTSNGCKSKFEVRINPQNPQAIQTPDPHLRSRPIQTSRSRPVIQTPCFILFGFVGPDPLFYFGVNMLDPAPSLPLWLDCGLEGHAV